MTAVSAADAPGLRAPSTGLGSAARRSSPAMGSAGWQADVGPAYGAEDKVSIGGMPGFAGKLTEDELYAVVVFERVVFGGGDTNEVLEDCGLLETEEEVTAEAIETSS